jgi:hypothetical protein
MYIGMWRTVTMRHRVLDSNDAELTVRKLRTVYGEQYRLR